MEQGVSTGAILFTDMVDSTALRTRLGDDRADLLRRHHDELLRSVTEAHRGSVLRWTGDGAKAGFSTASDAVSAAVAIQRAVVDYGASDEAVATFQVRVGLAVGEVTIDDGGDHRGVAVIEAARLEALARPGEILATDMVRLLGSRRSSVAFEEVGERILKGLDLPVMVHRVLDLERGSAPPIPRMLAVESRVPLVGREAALEVFNKRWDEARSGAGGLMLVRGETGIGKTRFVSRCAEIAHRTGGLVLAGGCGSDVPVPYEPFAAAFQAVATLDPTLAGAVEGHGPLARLFPSEDSGDAQRAVARLELFDEVAALVRRLSRANPAMLVLDDMHWASLPTVLLLRHLVDDCDEQRLLIVATARQSDLDSLHPMRDLLGSVGGRVATIDLAALNEGDVSQMVTAVAPAAKLARVAEVAELVCTESAGNPFFASALIDHLATTGQLERADDQSTDNRLPVPDSVHDVVLQRLVRLPQEAKDVLIKAAVIGPTFGVDLLADVAGLEADAVLDILDEVARSGMLSEVGIDQFAFVHAIVRNALLDELSVSRRARVHRRVAETLEKRGAEQFDELARHWQLAGEEGRSTRYLARAARRDMTALAFESAKACYREVVDQQNRNPDAEIVDRAEAWLGLAGALRALGDPSFTQAVVRAARLARSAHNGRLMGEAAALSSWLGVWFFTSEKADVELIELCEDALAVLDDNDPVRVRVLATLASHLTFAPDPGPRIALIAEARALAADHSDPLLTAAVLHAEFTCLWEPGTLDRREAVARELGRAARASGDEEVEFLGRYFAIYCQVERGDVLRARDALLDLRTRIDPGRRPYHAFVVERLILAIDILRCVPGIQAQVDQFQATFAGSNLDVEISWVLQTGLISLHSGTFGEMVNAAQAMTTGPQANLWTSAHALALLSRGEASDAGDLLDRYGDAPRNYFWTVFTQAYAEVAAALGRQDHCRRIFDDLLPFRGRIGMTGSGSGCFGLVSRTLGMLALALDEPATAEELLLEALEHAERIEATFDVVACRRLLAETYLALGLPEQVDEALGDALALAEEHGFAAEVELIRHLIEARSTGLAC